MSFFDHRAERFPLVSVSDYRLLAKKRLPKKLFDYVDGGASEEITLRLNRSDYEKIHFRKRVLRDVSSIDTGTEILGQKMDLPLILGPVGFAGVLARRGEVQAARAAETAKVPFSLSTMSICSMEELGKAISTPFWYQFYMFRERSHSLELLERAKVIGCPVLLLTVDFPMVGMRSRYQRNRQTGLLDSLLHPRWLIDVRFLGRPLTLGNVPKAALHLKSLPDRRKWMGDQVNPGSIWKDLEWIRMHWPGKIVLKGILDAEDAQMAAECGMDGIVISNHGGRHFDCIPSTISTLPKIVQKVGGRLAVLIDGGISSGFDLVKALALGADACMVGKPWAFALAARGEKGVSEILRILHQEMKIAMAHIGSASVREIDRKILLNEP